MSENELNTKIEDGDPSVPTDLLELHLELEDTNMTPEQFKEVFGDAAGNQS